MFLIQCRRSKVLWKDLDLEWDHACIEINVLMYFCVRVYFCVVLHIRSKRSFFSFFFPFSLFVEQSLQIAELRKAKPFCSHIWLIQTFSHLQQHLWFLTPSLPNYMRIVFKNRLCFTATNTVRKPKLQWNFSELFTFTSNVSRVWKENSFSVPEVYSETYRYMLRSLIS